MEIWLLFSQTSGRTVCNTLFWTRKYVGRPNAASEHDPSKVRLPGEQCIRDGRYEWYDPDQGDDPDGSLESGHGVRVQRVADCQVPLHAERHDGQHGRVGGPR